MMLGEVEARRDETESGGVAAARWGKRRRAAFVGDTVW
jgi:hypothetical protein